MRERRRPVDTRGHPCDEQSDEEQESDAGVEERFGVVLTERHAAGHCREAKDRRAGRSPGSLRLFLRAADLDVDRVRVVAFFVVAEVLDLELGFAFCVLLTVLFNVFGGDGDFGGGHDGREGRFVERVEVAG